MDMRRTLTGAGFGLLAGAILSAAAFAQGPPSSVTSMNFGGNGNHNSGVPASVTSLGFGNTGNSRMHNPFFNQPACCINPLFPSNSNRPGFGRHQRRFPITGGTPYYAVPYPVYVDDQPVDDSMEHTTAPLDEYRGGPTIFDRRGPGTPVTQENRYVERAPREEERSIAPAPEPPPAADQPETVLIFKDGHQVEVRNYAIIGDTLYDMTEGHRRRVGLAELNLEATVKQNDDRGIDFRLPPQAN